MHLLIAEDNSTNAKVLANILTRMGHTSELAVNGQEALLKTRQSGPFDAILMDLQMPEMDGLDAARAIIAELTPCPPIIACTANSFQSDRIAAAEAGMVGFVAKPVTELAIEATLSDAYVQTTPAKSDNYDWEQFDMVMSDRDEELMEIFNDFCEMTPISLQEIAAAVSECDWQSVADKTHQLRGTFSTFGVEFLSQKMFTIEQAALAGAVTMESNWLAESVKEFQTAEACLRQRIEQLV